MSDPTHLEDHLIACYVDGAVSAQDRAMIETHLLNCSSCRKQVLGIRRDVSVQQRRKTVRYMSFTATAAAAALVLVVVVPRGGPDMGTEGPVVATNVTGETGPIVSTQWLAAHAADPSVVLIHVDVDETGWNGPRFVDGHIPSAREIQFSAITFVKDSNGVEIPPADSMRSYFESRGISDSTHVIVTGHPLAVVRAYLTLSYLGLPHISVLDGGTTKWRIEGRLVVRGVTDSGDRAKRGKITLNSDPTLIVTRDFVRAHMGKPGYSYIDTRTKGEYVGQATWKGVRSTGHIAGSRQIDWQEYFQNDSDLALKPRAELKRLIDARVEPGSTVVAYCFNGGRSSSTFFVARVLGHPTKLYDGSYQDWARHREPTVVTPTALITN